MTPPYTDKDEFHTRIEIDKTIDQVSSCWMMFSGTINNTGETDTVSFDRDITNG